MIAIWRPTQVIDFDPPYDHDADDKMPLPNPDFVVRYGRPYKVRRTTFYDPAFVLFAPQTYEAEEWGLTRMLCSRMGRSFVVPEGDAEEVAEAMVSAGLIIRRLR